MEYRPSSVTGNTDEQQLICFYSWYPAVPVPSHEPLVPICGSVIENMFHTAVQESDQTLADITTLHINVTVPWSTSPSTHGLTEKRKNCRNNHAACKPEHLFVASASLKRLEKASSSLLLFLFNSLQWPYCGLTCYCSEQMKIKKRLQIRTALINSQIILTTLSCWNNLWSGLTVWD